MATSGTSVRAESHRLGTFCPRLDRDLSELAPFDAGSSFVPVPPPIKLATLTDVAHSKERMGQLVALYDDIVLISFAGQVQTLCDDWAPRLGRGHIVGIGARTYTRTQRDQMRLNQRFLPLTEIDPLTAARSAVLEHDEAPLWIAVELDILAAHLVPGIPPLAPGGITFTELQLALAAIPGHRVRGFDIIGLPEPCERNTLSILTGVQLLRDNILTWWGGTKGPKIPTSI